MFNKEEILKIKEKLKGLDWFAISGFAIFLLSNGKREFKDIDLVLKEKDIDIFAKRIGCKAGKRIIDKGTFIVDDYGFENSFENQNIEATNGYPPKRVDDNTFDKLFNRKVKVTYKGIEFFIAPIEEIIVQKAFMHREKDISDLKLLINYKLDNNFLIELAEDLGKEKEILEFLNKVGYKLR